MTDGVPPDASFAVVVVPTTVAGRETLVNSRVAMWKRLAAIWVGGPALMAAAFAVAPWIGALAALPMVVGALLTAAAPGVTVVYLIRDRIMVRRLRELPELAGAVLRLRSPGAD